MAIERDDAKTAWLQIQNHIIIRLNDSVRPVGASQIELNDVPRSTLTADQLCQGLRRFFEDLIYERDEKISPPPFCIRAGLLVDPRQHVLTNDLLVFVQKFIGEYKDDDTRTPSPRPSRKAWNSDFVKAIAANNTSACEWFDTIELNRCHLELILDRKKRIVRREGYDKEVDLLSAPVEWHNFDVALGAYPNQASLESLDTNYPGENNANARTAAVHALNKKLDRLKVRVNDRTLTDIAEEPETIPGDPTP